MKQGSSFENNIEFLINAYKNELENAEDDNRSLEEKELIASFIDDLEALIINSK